MRSKQLEPPEEALLLRPRNAAVAAGPRRRRLAHSRGTATRNTASAQPRSISRLGEDLGSPPSAEAGADARRKQAKHTRRAEGHQAADVRGDSLWDDMPKSRRFFGRARGAGKFTV